MISLYFILCPENVGVLTGARCFVVDFLMTVLGVSYDIDD